MILECFINASSETEAINILKSYLSRINHIQYMDVTAEPYWKMDGVFVTKVKEVYVDDLHSLLNLLADYWVEIGNPVEEYIASDNDPKQTRIVDGLLMAHIYDITDIRRT